MRGKANRTGRNEQPEHFTKMIRNTMETPAWRALSTAAQALYPHLKLGWRGEQNNNNGKISFSYRQAKTAMGVSLNTAQRAFHDLQAKGFLVITEAAALGIAGMGKAPTYELTELPLPGIPMRPSRKLYLQWEKGQDFPVQIHHANNPEGRNGRRIPSTKQRRTHLQKDDASPDPITKMKTPYRQNSDDSAAKLSATVHILKTTLVTIPRGNAPDLHMTAGLHLCPLLRDRVHDPFHRFNP